MGPLTAFSVVPLQRIDTSGVSALGLTGPIVPAETYRALQRENEALTPAALPLLIFSMIPVGTEGKGQAQQHLSLSHLAGPAMGPVGPPAQPHPWNTYRRPGSKRRCDGAPPSQPAPAPPPQAPLRTKRLLWLRQRMGGIVPAGKPKRPIPAAGSQGGFGFLMRSSLNGPRQSRP